ncbi:helix-turn-helix domain-containing protein [Micromonospora sp. M42]|uniref:helix-turn-helix domain-containing protein n=1 Tax=Micromonospora sp. M42 TaxID=457406 RepID=UPI002100810C|nr:helix-turn-helix domain-containing protein [Micromonospora sp. M42]
MHVHPNTVRYRLRRLRELTGGPPVRGGRAVHGAGRPCTGGGRCAAGWTAADPGRRNRPPRRDAARAHAGRRPGHAGARHCARLAG